jgi:hypothetical protein
MTSRRVLTLAAAAAIALASRAAPAPTPRPTPTPEPRLSGGFGKTPVATSPSRRTEKKAPVKLTNDTLVTEPDKGKLSTSNVRPPTPEPSPKGGSAQDPSASAAPSTEDREAYWRGESRRLREQVAALKENIARLEEETRRLESDFYAWDDGSYRDRVIKPAWDKAREELATARRELPLAEKDLADLPDRARRAGALPGWLRE